MRIRPIMTTVLGIAIAAGSVYLVKDRLQFQANQADASPSSEIVEVLVARSEIAFGQLIEGHLVERQAWPRDALPSGAFLELEALVPSGRENLRRAKGSFFPGEPFLASKVSNFGDKVTLVQKLGENTRAMAIKVDAVTAVGGFVTPGDFVDVVMTQGSSQDLRAVTILQNIRVIGVDQQSEEKTDQPEVARTITVEVSPEQGQRLALAQQAGKLSLTLRTLEGVSDMPMEMVRLSDLLQQESPVAERAVTPTVTVRRGTQTVEVTIKRAPQIEAVAPPAEAEKPAAKPVLQPVPVPLPLIPSLVKPQIRPINASQVPAQGGI